MKTIEQGRGILRVLPGRKPKGEGTPERVHKLIQHVFLSDPNAAFTSQTAWCPPTDVFETAGAYIIRMELAGVQRSDFTLVFKDRVLTVEGVRRESGKHSKVALHLMEINYGVFKRSLYLPDVVDSHHIEALYDAGFLEITLPKAPSVHRVIAVEGE